VAVTENLPEAAWDIERFQFVTPVNDTFTGLRWAEAKAAGLLGQRIQKVCGKARCRCAVEEYLTALA
jgi:hypothetical protein